MYAFESYVVLYRVGLLLDEKVVVLLVHEFTAVPEIHHENLVSSFTQPHQKIVRVNVVINDILGVYPLNPINKLINNNQHSF